MKVKITTLYVFLLMLVCIIVATAFPQTAGYIWGNIEKFGAAATALALFYAIRQSSIAQQAAETTEQASHENLYQQMFNLILEQHNNEMNNIKHWMSDAKAAEKFNHSNTILQENNTERAVLAVRGHPVLSPYMRLLHHTLKTIRHDEQRKRTPGNGQPANKKYASLVRSFIPDNLLKLVAINTLITNNGYPRIMDYQDYKGYNANLRHYAFFEHLSMRNRNINVKQLTEKLRITFRDSLCLLLMNQAKLKGYYESSGHFGSQETYREHDTGHHLTEINALIYEVDFCIALFYDLPGKYLVVDEHYVRNLPFIANFHELINQALDAMYQKPDYSIFCATFDKHIMAHIENVYNACISYIDDDYQASYRIRRPFLREGDGSLIEWLITTFHFGNVSEHRATLESDLQHTIRDKINASIMPGYQADSPFYQENVTRIQTAIYEAVHPLLSQITALEKRAKDCHNIETLKTTINIEVLARVNNFTANVNA
ncbi:putative phage abortive infection protein [Pantoea ananatis]|uniref:putative phage abortive infection protein n=1 Tax=Pantoea ananas TaxID=553 RepID=UPI0021F7DBB6|nr:putative phage abortive infection protein [Pantoea ananatis]MCW0330602.1 hypothetical protein [Pantoea ananatis]